MALLSPRRHSEPWPLPSRVSRALGFRELRVRHYGDLARIELPTHDLAHAISRRDEVVAAVRSAGYRYVTLDLEGFRSGT